MTRPVALLTLALVVGGLAIGFVIGRATADGMDAGDFINNQTVEAAIERDIRRQRDIPSDVSCPALVPLEEGATFDCVAVTEGDTRTTFRVRQLDDAGTVSYVAQ
jgi:hypothetical protein